MVNGDGVAFRCEDVVAPLRSFNTSFVKHLDPFSDHILTISSTYCSVHNLNYTAGLTYPHESIVGNKEKVLAGLRQEEAVHVVFLQWATRVFLMRSRAQSWLQIHLFVKP